MGKGGRAGLTGTAGSVIGVGRKGAGLDVEEATEVCAGKWGVAAGGLVE